MMMLSTGETTPVIRLLMVGIPRPGQVYRIDFGHEVNNSCRTYNLSLKFMDADAGWVR
ncbi:MAG TPA: hypothetical protein VMW13_05705 [Dehalococcoidales bacterium]|nr:hypothetical protein [Dehalococcoidales bacterium]